MMQKNKFKLQSAMEYLMTYGWAILIIAVVLTVLFSLGVFSGANLLPSTCIASSGYMCQTLFFKQTTGALTFTFGQSTGTNWASAKIYFVPSGSSYTGGVASASPSMTITNGLNSGATNSVTISIPGSTNANTLGSSLTGSLYLNYTITSGGTTYVAQVATISTKAQ
jgi:hypothetical protein